MDELTRQAFMVHKAILKELIDRVTALERLSSQGGRRRLSAQSDGEGNGVDPSERTDDEKTRCAAQLAARHWYFRDSYDV